MSSNVGLGLLAKLLDAIYVGVAQGDSQLFAALDITEGLGRIGRLNAKRNETLRNVALYVMPREILFFSVRGGVWTSVRLDAGERILQRGADGNVAAVLTSLRAIAFSATLNATHEIRVTDDETLENFKVEGNVVAMLTKRRAIGFSADTGRWADIERFQLGR